MLPDNVRPAQDFRRSGVMTPIQMSANVPIEDGRVTLMSILQSDVGAPVVEYAKDRAAKAKMLAASLADSQVSPTLLVFWPGSKSSDVWAIEGQVEIENALRRLGYRPRSEVQVTIGGEEWLSEAHAGGIATLDASGRVPSGTWPVNSADFIILDDNRIR